MDKPRPKTIPPLLPPAVALIAGITAARYFEFFPFTVTASCLLMAGAAFFVRRLSVPQRLSVLAFLAAGFAVYYMYGPGAPSYAGVLAARGETAVTGVVARPPQERDGYTVVYLRPSGSPAGIRRAGLVRLTVRGTALGIGYGDVLAGEFRLAGPAGHRNPGVFDWGGYARLNGIDAEASVKPERLYRAGNAAGAFMGRVYAFRRELIDRAKRSLPGPPGAIFRAMILGDQGGVDTAMRDVFSASGTTHILSVSGSHIALLSGAVFFGVGWLFGLLPAGWALRLSMRVDIRKLAAALTIPAAVSYCLIAGSEVATVRAAIMVCVFLLAVLVDRQNQVINTLSAAAIVVLVVDPFALFDISFRLSYLAVLFIALALERLRGWRPAAITGIRRIDGLAHRAMLAMAMSAAAIAGTAPLVAEQYNSFSYVALPANLVILPLAGVLAVPAGLMSCLIHAAVPGPGLPLAGLNAFAMELFYRVVGLFASAPHADIHPASPGIAFMSLYYAAFAGVLLWRTGTIRKAAAVGVAAVAIAVPVLHPASSGKMRVSFLDVGQGECAVVEFPGGGTMLIDCGGPPVGSDPGRSAAAPYLRDRGADRIDYLVISHPQPDHVSGLAYMVDNFPVGQIWEGGLVCGERSYSAMRRAAASLGVPRIRPAAGREMTVEGVVVQVLRTASSQVDDSALEPGSRTNNRSLVLRLRYGDVSFLFTGDSEAEALGAMLAEPGVPLGSTVLKVPHHGSRDACLPGFIDAVSPKVAVISAGGGNRFGHPWPGTVDELRRAGARVYCTCSDGAVTVETDGKSLDVSTWESGRPRKARSVAEEAANYARLTGI